MILGIGIDLIEVDRIRGSVERFGDRFLKRILTAEEIEYCRGLPDPAPNIAARFAAKEAISKAFGTGIGAELGWQDIGIGRKESGEPYVVLGARGTALLARRGGTRVLVSLSHTRGHAAAVGVVEADS